MATKPALITAWSFSRYGDYKKCPALFKYKHIDKLKEPPNAAMERGSAIHKLAENYVNGVLRTLPVELKLFADQFKKLKAQKIKVVEDSWTWTKEWAAETTWNDWAGAWLRVKLDVGYHVPAHNAFVPIDHKTGKFREDKNVEYVEQLELYALAALKKYPDISVASPRLWYLDQGRTYPDPAQGEDELEFFRKDEKMLEKTWAARIKPMFADSTFKPTPGDACRWCHFRKANGGPCKY